MKKIISALLIMSMALSFVFALPAGAEEDTVSVIVNNERVEFDQPPVIIDGSTLVPIRAVFEKAGAQVSWDQTTQTATLVRGAYTVSITLNDSVLYKNGTQVALSVPASMINDRVLIPVRAIGEAMDFSIAWDGYHSMVIVGTDGNNYRPYAARRYGFMDIADAASFYSDQSFAWKDVDANGDGVNETIAFTRTLDTSGEASPLLIIDGKDFTQQLSFMPSTYSFAVVDIDKSDGKKEIIVTANGDCLTAYFFRYDGENLTPVMNGDKIASVRYVSRLFFDEKSYILSDMEGLCFTDIMLTGSAYQLENGIITQYKVSNAINMIPRKLVHTYNDNMIYRYYTTDTFNGGSYRNAQPTGTVQAAELSEFTVTDMYVDDYNPSYIEFFVTNPDGTKMVLSPYSV